MWSLPLSEQVSLTRAHDIKSDHVPYKDCMEEMEEEEL